MNPIILYDNKLVGYSSIGNTSLASGYPVVNALDMRPNTKLKFAAAQTNYIIFSFASAINSTWIGFVGHNFGTANVTVKIYDDIYGTLRATKVCANDDAFVLNMPTMTSQGSITIEIANTSGNALPYVGCIYAGSAITFEYPFEGNAAFLRESINAETNSSNTGNLLGVNVRYTPVDFTHVFTNITRSWYASYFDPFWRAHGKLLKPFFYCADYDNTPEEAAFVRFKETYVNDKPVSLLDYYNSLTLDCKGTR